MQLYQKQETELTGLNPIEFKLEKEIQQLVESNLEQITGFKLVKSEYVIKNARIDTLAFDEESKAFVIIEYKRGRNDGLVDQGISYLSLMLEYKGDFIVEYNESCNKNLKRNDVDWSQSKVIFIAPSFNNYQKQSSNFNDLPIELWEIKQFENNILLINPLKKTLTAPSFKQIQSTTDQTQTKMVVEEIKVYTENDHLQNKSEEVRELFEEYKCAILDLSSDIDLSPKKHYIAFQTKRNICDIHIQQKGLKIWINLHIGELDDPKKLARDVSDTGHLGNGDYEFFVSDSNNLEYIMSLIKQAL